MSSITHKPTKDSTLDDLVNALQTILDAAEKSSFQAVGLLYLREVAGPVLRKVRQQKARAALQGEDK